MRAVIACGVVLVCVLASGSSGASRLNAIQRENALPGSAGWRVPQASSHAIEGYAAEVSVRAGRPARPARLDGARRPLPRRALPPRVVRGDRRPAGGVPAGGLHGRGGSGAADRHARVDGIRRRGLARHRHGQRAGRMGERLLRRRAPADDRPRRGPRQLGSVRRPRAGVAAGGRPRPGGRQHVAGVQPLGRLQPVRGPTGASCKGVCTHVSFDRPYDQTTQNLWEYELPLVHFLEESGEDVSYTTDVDIDADPGELLRHRLVIVAGHDEYWTKAMRDGFDAARAASTNLAFMGANDGYWQMRYADDRRTIVEYRVGNLDPVSDPALKTRRFRDLVPPRPECLLEGVQYRRSGEAESIGGQHDYSVAPALAGGPLVRGHRLHAGQHASGTGRLRMGCDRAGLPCLRADRALPLRRPARLGRRRPLHGAVRSDRLQRGLAQLREGTRRLPPAPTGCIERRCPPRDVRPQRARRARPDSRAARRHDVERFRRGRDSRAARS